MDSISLPLLYDLHTLSLHLFHIFSEMFIDTDTHTVLLSLHGCCARRKVGVAGRKVFNNKQFSLPFLSSSFRLSLTACNLLAPPCSVSGRTKKSGRERQQFMFNYPKLCSCKMILLRKFPLLIFSLDCC